MEASRKVPKKRAQPQKGKNITELINTSWAPESSSMPDSSSSVEVQPVARKRDFKAQAKVTPVQSKPAAKQKPAVEHSDVVDLARHQLVEANADYFKCASADLLLLKRKTHLYATVEDL